MRIRRRPAGCQRCRPPADRRVAEYFEECRLEGSLLHLVIAGLESDDYLGEVVVVLGEHRVGELGCGVVRAARGRGIATEALRLLSDWALDTLGLGRLEVFVAPQNPAALRLAERAGFRREGVLRAYWEGEEERARRRRPLAAPDRRAMIGRSGQELPLSSPNSATRTRGDVVHLVAGFIHALLIVVVGCWCRAARPAPHRSFVLG